MGQIADVDPPGGYVRGHQEAKSPLLDPVEGVHAFAFVPGGRGHVDVGIDLFVRPAALPPALSSIEWSGAGAAAARRLTIASRYN